MIMNAMPASKNKMTKYQNKCPHIVTTGYWAICLQELHENWELKAY
jgi:hypothetical protein